jgi:O-antigen ligase
MKRSLQSLVLFGLILAVGFAVFARGAHLRIYWLPVATLIVFLLAGFLISLNHRVIPVRFNLKTDIPLLLFLGWATLSIFSSINQEESIFEVTRLSTMVMVYFLVAYALPPEPGKKVLGFALVGIGFIEATYGLSEFILHKPLLQLTWVDLPRSIQRVTGTLVNYNHFAGLMEMCIFLGFGLMMAVGTKEKVLSEQLAKRMLLAIPCGIMILALILSLSRGGWASFILGALFFLAIFLWKEHPLWSRILAIALMVLVLIGAFIMGVNREPLIKRFESLEALYQEPEHVSSDTRISIWKSSAAMIRDHPWTGTGWGTYRSAYPSYRRDYFFRGVAFAHNDYLQIAAGMGLPGLFFFMLFLFMLFREGFHVMRTRDQEFWAQAMPGVMAALFVILFHELVDFNLMIPSNAMVFFALAGIVSARARSPS